MKEVPNRIIFDKSYEKRHRLIIRKSPVVCEKCGKRMYHIFGQFGWFLGCSDKNCRHTRNSVVKKDFPIEIVQDGWYRVLNARRGTEVSTTSSLSAIKIAQLAYAFANDLPKPFSHRTLERKAKELLGYG